MAPRYDALIVGCGLAGATLAWQLHWAGYRLLVFDRQDSRSASRAAAGLISLLSGKRHTRTEDWDTYWPDALAFYRQLEGQTGTDLLRQLRQLRFVNANEATATVKNAAVGPSTLSEDAPYKTPLTEKAKADPVFNIESAVLDVDRFLDITFDMLHRQHCLRQETLAFENLVVEDKCVRLRNENIEAKIIVFCEGWHARRNPFFNDIEFEPVRGETLRITCNDLPDDYIYHRDISVVPKARKQFIVGATYDRDDLNSGPTRAGKDQLSSALKALLSSPFGIDAHSSGVRPVIKGRRPSFSQHKDHAHLWFFNGLASKACLWAPHLSAALSKALNTPNTSKNPFTPAFSSGVESAYDTDRQHRERLTTVAHRIIREKLREGQIAIDATAGNGNDTLLLVKSVGPEGYVYAFDIQPLAIIRTKERVGMTHTNLSLINDSHVEIPRHVTPAHREKIALVTFNLGYLPGGDETITTQPESSCQAVANVLTLLQPGGNCLILCYRGHAGGNEETDRIIALLDELDRDRFRIERHQSENHSDLTPILFRVEKSSTQSSKV